MSALIAVPAGIGYPVLFAFVAAESAGALVPGETSLIIAAALAAQGKLSLPLVIAVAAGAAIIGDNIALPDRARRASVACRPAWWLGGRQTSAHRARGGVLRSPRLGGRLLRALAARSEGRHFLARRCRQDAVAALSALERFGRDRLGEYDRRARLHPRPKRIRVAERHRFRRNRRRRCRLPDHARPPLACALSETTGRPTAPTS